MNLCNLVAYHPKGKLSEVNTKDMYFFVRKDLYGNEEYMFHPTIYYLLDRVFLKDITSGLGSDQEKHLMRFLKDAHTITTNIKNGSSTVYSSDVVDFSRDLDRFLGSTQTIVVLNLISELSNLRSVSNSEVSTQGMIALENRIKEIEEELASLNVSNKDIEDSVNLLLENAIVKD